MTPKQHFFCGLELPTGQAHPDRDSVCQQPGPFIRAARPRAVLTLNYDRFFAKITALVREHLFERGDLDLFGARREG